MRATVSSGSGERREPRRLDARPGRLSLTRAGGNGVRGSSTSGQTCRGPSSRSASAAAAGHELLEVLVEGAVAALLDHLGLGDGAGGGVPHRVSSGSIPPQTTDTAVTCPAPVRQLTSVSADWTSGLASAAARAEPCSCRLDVTVNARMVQPALSMERTTTLAPTPLNGSSDMVSFLRECAAAGTNPPAARSRRAVFLRGTEMDGGRRADGGDARGLGRGSPKRRHGACWPSGGSDVYDQLVIIVRSRWSLTGWGGSAWATGHEAVLTEDGDGCARGGCGAVGCGDAVG